MALPYVPLQTKQLLSETFLCIGLVFEIELNLKWDTHCIYEFMHGGHYLNVVAASSL